MEVSTFELLVKRIAPPQPPGSPGAAAFNAVSRRVIQGYFLTITNLEESAVFYQLVFVQSTPQGTATGRSLDGGTAEALIDIAGENSRLRLLRLGSTDRFQVIFTLPAKQTASVQLLPRLTVNLVSDNDPPIEIRGYVELLVSRFLNNRGFRGRNSVKVLLNPETRGTFLPNNFPNVTTGDFDQLNYPMVVASGKALNEIELEDPPRRTLSTSEVAQLSPELFQNEVLTANPNLNLLASNNVELVGTLATLLEQVEPSEETLGNISDLLSRLEIPIRMERVNS